MSVSKLNQKNVRNQNLYARLDEKKSGGDEPAKYMRQSWSTLAQG
jgi:hypothetical protein